MLVAKKYVALCTNLHGIGHDKATYATQNKNKRYIIGIMRLDTETGFRFTAHTFLHWS